MRLLIATFLVLYCGVYLAQGTALNLKWHIMAKSPKPVNDDAVIAHVNNAKTSWKAGRTDFHSRSHLEKASYASHITPKKSPPRAHSLCSGGRATPRSEVRQAARLPASFDARSQWPDCSSIIGDIRRQGQCGSCWAFSSTSVFADRLCIHRGIKTKISAQDLVSCMPADFKTSDNADSSGDLCQGGDYLTLANRMFVFKGAVTGGDFESKSGCYPYNGAAFRNGVGTECAEECTNFAYDTPYAEDKITAVNAIFMGHQPASTWGLSLNQTYFYTREGVIEQSTDAAGDLETLIKNELMTYGSVNAAFTVWNDFYSYKTGVYQKTNAPNNEDLGGHAIKIIGWGTEGGVPFWLCVNSWGTNWGENGTFKILRGSNHLGIENYIVGTRLEEIQAAAV